MQVLPVRYNGYIYGVNVPPNHIMRVRRNGKECWTGNSGRDVGGYSSDQQPSKGGSTGAKRLSQLDVNALLAHGAPEVLKDALLIRGTKNEDYWNAVRAGRPLPAPQVPFVYTKFINLLKAGGINVQRDGDILSIMPLTNADVDSISRGEIKNSDTVDSKLRPIKGGLFDPATTGGFTSSNWNHIALAEPMPNPIMEEPVRRLLGLTVKGYMDVLTGREELDGLTGGAAIAKALGKIDMEPEIERYRREIQTRRGAGRDNAVKAMRYLVSARRQGIHPSEWMIDRVPVLPAVFRPVSQIGDMVKVADINELYRELIEINNGIGELRQDLPESELAEHKAQLYAAVQAAFGLGEAVSPEGQSKRLKGAIRQVVGTNPKCYDSETELLTDNGWVPFPAIAGNERVGTINPISGQLEFQTPVAVIHQDYSGPMVHTLTKKLDLLVTPNHEHWTGTRGGRHGWHPSVKVAAAELLVQRRQHRFVTWDGKPGCSVAGPHQHRQVEYVGKVHCVQVPNGLLVVRRNGKPAVSGNSGLLQSKVLSKTVDAVGRGVAIPNPQLDMDSVGIPADMAWDMYRPHVIRRLVRRGFPPELAASLVAERKPEAQQMLEDEMKERVVLMDRAPTWHKFNLLAFYPHLVEGTAIQTNPLIVSGLNLDYDGDTVNIHVPASDKAVVQARERMLPSRNLFKLTDRRSPMHTPGKEMVMGLYQMTRPPAADKQPIVFKTVQEAKAALHAGLIRYNDPIEILELG